MDIVTLTSFEDELRLIKMADSAPWKSPSIAPVTMAAAKKPAAWKHAPQHSKEVADGLKNLFKNYGTKALSKHGAAGALGALGGGLALMHGGLKEWDSRAAENRAMSRIPPEQQAAAKQHIDALRLHRLKRLGVNTAIAGGTGALMGHYGGKAVRSLSESASKGAAQHLKPALEEALTKGFGGGIREGQKSINIIKMFNPFRK